MNYELYPQDTWSLGYDYLKCFGHQDLANHLDIDQELLDKMKQGNVVPIEFVFGTIMKLHHQFQILPEYFLIQPGQMVDYTEYSQKIKLQIEREQAKKVMIENLILNVKRLR